MGVKVNPGGKTVALSNEQHWLAHLQILTSDENPFARTQPFKVPAMWVGHSATDHGWPPDAAWLGIPIFVPNTTNTVLSPAFALPFSDMLTQVLGLLDAAGLGGRGIVKFYDEPSMDAATLNAVARVAELIKKIAAAANTSLAIRISGGVLTEQLAPWFDVWDVHAAYITPMKDYVAQAADRYNVSISVYDNGANLVAQPLLRTRAFFWAPLLEALAAFPLAGTLSWWSLTSWSSYTQPKGDPFDWAHYNATNFFAQSGVLLYPPLPDSAPVTGTVSSLRWEQTLLGLQDLALLEMLSGLCDAAAGDDAQQQQVRRGRKALADVTRVISRLPAVRPPNDLPFTVDVNVLEEVRGEVVAAIADLTKK